MLLFEVTFACWLMIRGVAGRPARAATTIVPSGTSKSWVARLQRHNG